MLKSENKKGVCVHRWREPIVPSHSHFLCSVDKVEWSAFCVLQYPMKKSLNTMFCCTLSRLLSRHYFGTNWMLSVPFHFTRWPELLCVSERIASSILLAGAPLLLLKLSLVPIFGTVDNCPSEKQQGGDLKIAIMTFYFSFVQCDHAMKRNICFKFQLFYLQHWKNFHNQIDNHRNNDNNHHQPQDDPARLVSLGAQHGISNNHNNVRCGNAVKYPEGCSLREG